MRAMKDSGIAWIGQIPEGWNILPTSSLFYEHKQRNRDLEENNLLSLSYGKIKRKDINTQEGLLPQTFDNYNIINNGDIVFRLTDLQNDKKSLRTGLCNERGIITSAYLTIRAKEEASSSYFHYLFHTYDVCKVFYGLGDGVRQGMGYNDLRSLLIFCPPLSEQERIADFLDSKCAEIDEMIALQEKTVEELKAYKQSVITEAVTKGLNPDAPMKDSGIPWIGLIPQGWKVGKAKNLCTFLNGYAYNSNDFLKEGKFPVIRIGDIQDGHISYDNIVYVNDSVGLDVYKTHIGDILIAMSGATTGKVGRVLEGEDGYINQRVGIIRSIEQEFVYYLFQTKVFEEYVKLSSIGSAQPNISSKGILNYTIVIPSHDEQQAIASYLDKKCSEIDSLIEIKQQKAEELKNYKKSLIYEYVTGKKEVV